MAALPPKDPRRPVAPPLRTVVNRSTSATAMARKREADRVSRLVNPPKETPTQKPSEQYGPARRRLQELDAAGTAAAGRPNVDPQYSVQYWRRRAEDHKRAVELRAGRGTSPVASGATTARSVRTARSSSNEPFDEGPARRPSPTTTAVRRVAPSAPITPGRPPPATRCFCNDEDM